MAGSQIDPKVYFANERTFLKWLHTSVTIGSVASALVGISSLNNARSAGYIALIGFDPLRIIGLCLLVVAILFTSHALISFHQRNKMLALRSVEGIDDNSAPLILSIVLTFSLFVIYVSYLLDRSGVKII